MTTISLEPNYQALFTRFSEALPGELLRCTRTLMNGDQYAALQSLVVTLNLALETATTVENIERLRELLATQSEWLSNLVRNKDVEEAE